MPYSLLNALPRIKFILPSKERFCYILAKRVKCNANLTPSMSAGISFNSVCYVVARLPLIVKEVEEACEIARRLQDVTVSARKAVLGNEMDLAGVRVIRIENMLSRIHDTRASVSKCLKEMLTHLWSDTEVVSAKQGRAYQSSPSVSASWWHDKRIKLRVRLAEVHDDMIIANLRENDKGDVVGLQQVAEQTGQYWEDIHRSLMRLVSWTDEWREIVC